MIIDLHHADMKYVVIILLGFLLTASSLNDPRRANEAFQRGDFEEAVQLYRQAINKNPDNARLYFNLGNAYSKLGNTEEALSAFEEFKRRSKDSRQQSLADYNSGRLLSDNEQYEDALSFYREALRKNPEDEDARHNYELAQRKLHELEQQQPEPDPQSGEEEQEQDGDNNQDQDNQEQDGDQDRDQNQQPSAPQEQEGDQEQQQRQQEMSREEAENLLDALEQLERELLENQKKEATESSSSNDRDW